MVLRKGCHCLRWPYSSKLLFVKWEPFAFWVNDLHLLVSVGSLIGWTMFPSRTTPQTSVLVISSSNSIKHSVVYSIQSENRIFSYGRPQTIWLPRFDVRSLSMTFENSSLFCLNLKVLSSRTVKRKEEKKNLNFLWIKWQKLLLLLLLFLSVPFRSPES